MTSVPKYVVILANSRRPNGRCIAGIELISSSASEWTIGDWVRPVSARASHEIQYSERIYESRTEPALLDVVYMELIRLAPGCHQPENWLLNSEITWVKKGEIRADQLASFVTSDSGDLWDTGNSTINGVNDAVAHDIADQVSTSSLRLVRADEVVLETFDGSYDQRRHVYATFALDGHIYKLAVTDPIWEDEYKGAVGNHRIGPAYLTISLTEEYKGRCYKVVAGILSVT